LPDSDYAVSASRAGYVDGNPDPLSGPLDRTPLTLTQGRWISNLRIELAKLTAISGTVLDETGEPVVGAFVRAVMQVFVAGNAHLASSVVARTDDRGTYRLAGLPPGSYAVLMPSVQSAVPADASDQDLSPVATELRGIGPPPAPRTDAAVAIGDRSRWIMNRYLPPAPATGGALSAYPITFYPGVRTLAESTSIQLKKGEDRTGVDFRIAPVPTWRVSGTVEAPPGVVVKGLPLRLMAAGVADLGNGGETATTVVAADGTFMFVNVPAGNYSIVASRSRMEYLLGSRPSAVDFSIPSAPGTLTAYNGGGAITGAVPGLEYHYSNPQASAA
jgi:hypothetical protein